MLRSTPYALGRGASPGGAAAVHAAIATPALTAVAHTLVAPAGRHREATQVLGEKITRIPSRHRTPSRVTAVSARQLPFTGLPTGMLVLLGLTALGVGGAPTVTGARRRSGDATPMT